MAMPISRYPGVTSFTDDAVSSRLFFGRDEEKQKLLHFIVAEHLIILYAKSGHGKTSLLQAGVFGMLRDRNFFPFTVRFNQKEYTPHQSIHEKLKILAATPGDFEIDNVAPTDNLVQLFEKLEIWTKDNKLCTPIIVLDQFEEIFTLEHNKPHQKNFFEALRMLLNAAKDKTVHLKIVLSIREDFLGYLESLAGNIPSIFSNRFRLEALKLKNAEAAIIEPAALKLNNVEFKSPPIYFSDDAKAGLLNFLCNKQDDNKTTGSEIDPINLQIICSDIEERVKLGEIKPTNGAINISQKELGGEAGMKAILGNFYTRQLKKLSEELKLTDTEINAVRDIVEKRLIVVNRRVPMDKDAILNTPNIRKEAIELLLENKLLKEESHREKSKLIEISHDALVEPILSFLKKREEIERQQKMEAELAEKERLLQQEKDKVATARKLKVVLYVMSALLIGIAYLLIYSNNARMTNKMSSVWSWIDKEDYAKADSELNYHAATKGVYYLINYASVDSFKTLNSIIRFRMKQKKQFDTLMSEAKRHRTQLGDQLPQSVDAYKRATRLQYISAVQKSRLQELLKDLKNDVTLAFHRYVDKADAFYEARTANDHAVPNAKAAIAVAESLFIDMLISTDDPYRMKFMEVKQKIQ